MVNIDIPYDMKLNFVPFSLAKIANGILRAVPIPNFLTWGIDLFNAQMKMLSGTIYGILAIHEGRVIMNSIHDIMKNGFNTLFGGLISSFDKVQTKLENDFTSTYALYTGEGGYNYFEYDSLSKIRKFNVVVNVENAITDFNKDIDEIEGYLTNFVRSIWDFLKDIDNENNLGISVDERSLADSNQFFGWDGQRAFVDLNQNGKFIKHEPSEKTMSLSTVFGNLEDSITALDEIADETIEEFEFPKIPVEIIDIPDDISIVDLDTVTSIAFDSLDKLGQAFFDITDHVDTLSSAQALGALYTTEQNDTNRILNYYKEAEEGKLSVEQMKGKKWKDDDIVALRGINGGFSWERYKLANGIDDNSDVATISAGLEEFKSLQSQYKTLYYESADSYVSKHGYVAYNDNWLGYAILVGFGDTSYINVIKRYMNRINNIGKTKLVSYLNYDFSNTNDMKVLGEKIITNNWTVPDMVELGYELPQIIVAIIGYTIPILAKKINSLDVDGWPPLPVPGKSIPDLHLVKAGQSTKAFNMVERFSGYVKNGNNIYYRYAWIWYGLYGDNALLNVSAPLEAARGILAKKLSLSDKIPKNS